MGRSKIPRPRPEGVAHSRPCLANQSADPTPQAQINSTLSMNTADNGAHFPSGSSVRKWAVKKKFVGYWRITVLVGFAAEYLDLCGPAMIIISPGGIGQMNFGAVEIELDCKMDDLNDMVLRFSFEGADEGDPISGRGYCLDRNDEMTGRILRHCGDEMEFKAQRVPKIGKPNQSKDLTP